MRAQKLPSGATRYRVEYKKDDGTRAWKSFTDMDAKAAKRAAERFRMSVSSISVSSFTFSKMLDAYIKSREAILSPSTIRGYRNIQKALESDFGAFMSLTGVCIDKASVQNVLNDLKMSEKSDKTIRNYSGLISATLRSNDIFIGKLVTPMKRMRNIYVPSIAEVKKLIEEVKGTELEVPVLLGAYLGMRRGEICALKMSDIDFKKKVIHVQRDVVMGSDRKWHVKPPKTIASDRFIDMQGLEFILDAIKLHGVPTLNPKALSSRFGRKVKGKFRFHDLRHFCASYLHSVARLPDQSIQQRLGWETDETLKAVYRHTLADQHSADIRKANEIFAKM